MASGVFEEVEVEHTDDPDQLVIALCQFRPFYTERDVADAARGDLVRPGALPVLGGARGAHRGRYVEFEAASRASESATT